jgi:hypothetical protein
VQSRHNTVSCSIPIQLRGNGTGSYDSALRSIEHAKFTVQGDGLTRIPGCRSSNAY